MISELAPKERLLGVLDRARTDRPPVICTGGMMNAAIVHVMEETGHTLPLGHVDAAVMSELARDVRNFTGFENFGLPFCMTVEAEALGSRIDLGDLASEPKIAGERFAGVRDGFVRDVEDVADLGRIRVVADAVQRLAAVERDVPIVGNLTGPISTAASLVDPMTFLKELRKDPDEAHRLLEEISDFLVAYARLLLARGATVISIGDPTATGEILGPEMFSEYAVRYLNRIVDGIHAVGANAIVHICGDLRRVRPLLPKLRADALSTDSVVNLKALKDDFPQIVTMGNVSTYLLQFGSAGRIAARTRLLLDDGIDIISPACGLSTSTPLENIRALTETVRSA
jgi:[methyl-Co(III) methanol-specific corrinoid protein]:coenzyme M methyltransferase